MNAISICASTWKYVLTCNPTFMVNEMFEITIQTLLFLEFWEIQNYPPPPPPAPLCILSVSSILLIVAAHLICFMNKTDFVHFNGLLL